MKTYDFFQISSSRFRNVIGEDNYNNHWNTFLTSISSSQFNINLTNSQIQETEQWLINCENSTSGSQWFEEIYGNN